MDHQVLRQLDPAIMAAAKDKNKVLHRLWLDSFIETRVITTHKCTKCGATHADVKSARICVEQCSSGFKSPDEFYRRQAGERITKI